MIDEDSVLVEMEYCGQIHLVAMSREDAARRSAALKNFAIVLAEHRAQAKAAVNQIKLSDSSQRSGAVAVAASEIESCCVKVGSGKRLVILLDLLKLAPSDLFWHALLTAWSGIDDTWSQRVRLLGAMRKHARRLNPHTFMSQEERREFDALPVSITVFRGCSRRRSNSVSWTLRKDVAEGFARGHRGIPVPDPVMASGQITKDGVFAFLLNREEAELLIDPRRVTGLTTIPVAVKAAPELND